MKVLVFTTVFPSREMPNFGIFVRERMRRVADLCDVKVIAPVPFFPFAGVIKRNYAIKHPRIEHQGNLEVHHPRFFVIPGLFKFLDGFFLFLSTIFAVSKLRKDFDFDLIDAHFAYPDGFAAVLLGQLFKRPVVITLRGTLNRLIRYRLRRAMIKVALNRAARIFSVSPHLIQLAEESEARPVKYRIIPNGVDTQHFKRVTQKVARANIGIDEGTKVIISVGGLVERKGHHRVIEALPQLVGKFPDIIFLVVGGPSVEGDISSELRMQIQRLGLENHVRLVGEVPHDQVSMYLSAADIFVLATRYEGCPNVFLEAMACGLPVVTTLVCGNEYIVEPGRSGLLVPFGDKARLGEALQDALTSDWNHQQIIEYAHSRTWENVAKEVVTQFDEVLNDKLNQVSMYHMEA